MTEHSLSDDEFTCLCITAEGQSMMAIGRWEKPIERLVQLGYLRQFDKFNNMITPAGKAAMEGHATRNDDAYLRLSVEVHNTRVRAKNALEEAAKQLAEAAQLQQQLSGAIPEHAGYELAQIILKRALEILAEKKQARNG